MKDLFLRAAKTDPQHFTLIRNVNLARAWLADRGDERGLPLSLEVRLDFQLLERTVQPTLPGPLPPDFAVWSAPLQAEPAPHYLKTPDAEGSTHDLGPRARLKVLP